MRSLILEVPEDLRIEINGHIFNVNKSDIDILNKLAEFQSKYADLKKGDFKRIREAVNDVIAYIDEILGESAFMKISGSKPVNITRVFSWLNLISREVSQMNDDYISEKYE